jgi:hypothetical protein
MNRIFYLLACVASVPVWACSCSGWPSAKDAWKSSPAVFLGLVQQADPNREGEKYVAEQTVLALVDEAFKGAKKGQVFTLKQPGHNCAPKFKAGERVLFYIHPGDKPGEWEAHGCHRTRRYGSASDDLLFLQQLPASAAGNRLSGEVDLYEDGPKGFRKVRPLAGVRVTATPHDGLPKIMTTNADGVYEWYGLPVGEYKVEVEVPGGMRIRFPMATGGKRGARDGFVYIGAESGVSVDYILMSDTKITGRVLDPAGKPMNGVRVDIRPVSLDDGAGNSPVFDRTKSGKFLLEMMPPGQYYVVANRDGRVTASEPFPTIYYPGAANLKQAVPVTVPEGGTVESIDIRIPAIRKTVELVGRVVFSDGVPVPKAFVKFVGKAERDSESTVAESDGSFRLRILSETEGELQAEVMLGSNEATACPQFASAIAPNGFTTSLKSVPVFVGEKSPASQITLFLQVASCKSWPSQTKTEAKPTKTAIPD